MRGFVIVGCLIIGCAIGAYFYLDSWIGVGFVFVGIWLTFLFTGRLLSLAGFDSKLPDAAVGLFRGPGSTRGSQQGIPQPEVYHQHTLSRDKSQR